jgi:hypothetical protein
MYYQVEQHHRPRAREVKSTRQQTTSGFAYIPFCTHPSGEFSLTNVLLSIKAVDALKCNGDVSKCQLKNGKP